MQANRCSSRIPSEKFAIFSWQNRITGLGQISPPRPSSVVLDRIELQGCGIAAGEENAGGYFPLREALWPSADVLPGRWSTLARGLGHGRQPPLSSVPSL